MWNQECCWSNRHSVTTVNTRQWTVMASLLFVLTTVSCWLAGLQRPPAGRPYSYDNSQPATFVLVQIYPPEKCWRLPSLLRGILAGLTFAIMLLLWLGICCRVIWSPVFFSKTDGVGDWAIYHCVIQGTTTWVSFDTHAVIQNLLVWNCFIPHI